jgi:dephospho-CoA kinase
MPTEEKAARSDFVIVNDSTIEKLKEKIAFLAEEIRKEFKGE